MTCEHVQRIRDVQPITPRGCEECLAEGGRWVELRLCLSCGHVGCCDSSRGKHATAHFERSGHPVMRAFEEGEGWGWCYVDRLTLPAGEVYARQQAATPPVAPGP